MRNGKHGLSAFGVALLAAMGLMAVMAAGAQAITWDLQLQTSTVDTDFDTKLSTELLLLATTAGGVPIVIHCKKLTVDGGLVLFLFNTAHGGFLYAECLTLVSGVNSKNCGYEAGGGPGITILQANTTLRPVLHNNVVYLLMMQIHYGPLCSLPLASVKGSVLFECEDAEKKPLTCAEDLVVHRIRTVANQGLIAPGDSLTYGLNAATMHAGVEIFLTGIYSGMFFAALI
jgi:hypothetical protein